MEIKYSLEDFDGKKIINKYGMSEDGSTRLFLANTCARRMAKYVPKDTGALLSTITVYRDKVVYEQPYAHKQYTSNKGKGIRGKYWDKKMVNNEGHLVAQEVENYAKKLKGNG